jgi:phenylacetate-CoA ligase
MPAPEEAAMMPWLVRNLILPVHEWLVGRKTMRCWRELEASQWRTGDEIRGLQERKLRDLLLHAWDRCPAHRARLANAGLGRADLAHFRLAHLAHLPLLDRATIADQLPGLVDWRVPGGAARYTTGGSTGVPLIFYCDRRRQAYDKAARMRAHNWFAVAPGDREVFLWGAPVELSRQDRLKALRDRLTNQLLLSAFAMSAETMARYLGQIDRYRPACLFGYPSTLALLAEFARERRAPAPWKGLKVVFVTGEVLYAHQRRLLEEVFRVPVANEYGARDAGFLAHQCPEGNMHLAAENVIVEAVDADGTPVLPGQSGEVVVTHLDNFALPFLRYRTGDRGKLSDRSCPCRRGLPLMEVIEGRSTDLLVRPDGARVHALALIYTLRDLPGVRQFKIHQRAPDRVEVRVVRGSGYASAHEERIRREFGQSLGAQVRVEVVYVDHIRPERSGKYRYVTSDIGERQEYHEPAHQH